MKEMLQQLKNLEAIKFRCERAEEAHAWLEAVVTSSDNAIISARVDGTITTWNLGAEKIYGYSAEEILNRPIALLVSPGHRDEIPSILSKIARGESVKHYETVGMRKDGRPIRISLSVSPIKDAGGQIIGISLIASDRIEFKRISEALRSINERLSEILNSITDAYFALDYQWRFLEINQVTEKLFNRPAKELMGKVLWDECPEAVDTEFYQQYQIAASERRPVHTEAYFSVADRWFETHVYPRHDRLETYFRDITERKRAEGALRKSEELSRTRLAELQVIYTTAPTGLCFMDTALRYVSVNEKFAEMSGLSVEEHLGRTVREAVPSFADLCEASLRRVIETGKPVNLIFPKTMLCRILIFPSLASVG